MAKKKDKLNAPDAENAENKGTTSETPDGGSSVDASKYSYVIQNKKARALVKHRKAIIIAGIVLLIALVLAGVFYAFYSAVEINSFRIYVDSSGSRVLSLSVNPEMEPSSELIELVGPSNMTNTTLASGRNIVSNFSIEDKFLEIIDARGSATKVDDYFIAGTFYVKNVTTEDKQYTERVIIEQAEKGTAKALRILIIKNDDIDVYAYPQTDADGNILYDEEGNVIPEEVVPLNKESPYYPYTERTLQRDENGVYYVRKADDGKAWMTKPFYNDSGNYEHYAVLNNDNVIGAGQVIRYSIIIWFEGWDKDCVDDILDGKVNMTLSFACE